MLRPASGSSAITAETATCCHFDQREKSCSSLRDSSLSFGMIVEARAAMAMGWYLHIDMDAFFASVEQVLDPSMRGKPVIFAGRNGRGVVPPPSSEPRSFGVHSAMPAFQARRLCPAGSFVPTARPANGGFYHKVFPIL